MHHGTPLMCHCEERSDVAISQYPAASWESNRRNRNCLPEIAPQGHFLALRAQGATSAVGLLAMTKLTASRHKINAANNWRPAWRSQPARGTPHP